MKKQTFEAKMVEGIAFWNENCVEFSTEQFQNYPLVDSVNQENDEDCEILGFEQCSISKRMRLSPEFTLQVLPNFLHALLFISSLRYLMFVSSYCFAFANI